jgi:hypothetical protein
MSDIPPHAPLARRASLAPLLALAAILAAGSTSGGCTTRDRLNPLDPANQETGGAIPGFAAVAANGLVELRWVPLKQQGIESYVLHRWTPGGTPMPLPGAVFSPAAAGTVDFDVENDSSYLYRLVARFSYGDSALSPPDSATPGNRIILVMGAEDPGILTLSPDARDVILAVSAANAFEDFDIDRDRNVLWLSDPASGAVFRRGLNGEDAGVTLFVPGVSDLSVSSLRGVGWVVSPDHGLLQAFGPSLQDDVARVSVPGLGRPRVVEAGSLDPSVWVGTDEGVVFRVNPSDGVVLEQWTVTDPVRAIALDQAASAAWVVTNRGGASDLRYLVSGDASTPVKRAGLDNVADVEVETATRTLWVSERGLPRFAAGRISRLALDGSTIASRAGLEAYGLAVEAGKDHVWVTDLGSNRVLELDANASLVRPSPPIGVPYGVIVHTP